MSGILAQNFDDSEDEEDFNPSAEVDEDEQAAGDESDAEERPRQSTNGASRGQSVSADEDEDDERPRNTVNGNRAEDDQDEDENEDDERRRDEDNDGEDDEEDEDEDEDDEVVGRPRKRRRRDPRNQFIDEMAEVDDEEEEDAEDDEDDMVGDAPHPDDLADLPAGAETDDRRHRELDRQRELVAQMDAEEQAAKLREKYGRQRRTAQDTTLQPEALLQPDESDPKIWAVRCKAGKEREIVIQLMNKLASRAGSKDPYQVFSAFAREGVGAGYVYVEAYSQSAVETVCQNVTNVYTSSKVMLIAMDQMTDLLVKKKDKELAIGQYIRVKRGIYAGDLAQIVDVLESGAEVDLKLVPRVDYGLNEDLNAPVADASKRKRPGGGAGPRPPARLFNETEARKKLARFLTPGRGLSRNEINFRGKVYQNGYLIDRFRINTLQIDNVNPTLEEVSKFAEGVQQGEAGALDLNALSQTMKQNTTGADYLPGDTVEIYQGEQQGVWGKATAVRGDIVSIKVTEGPLAGQTVDASVKSLRKMFKEGDHVKVIGASKYRDEVGMVVKVTADRVTLVTDANEKEIEVFSKDLREAADTSGMPSSVSKYDLYDLVQLDATRVAIVIKVDRESLRVLDQDNMVKTLLPSNISNKLERRRHAVTADRDGNEIKIDDTVKEVGGNTRQGRVLHIHRRYVFIQDRNRVENSGIFAAQNTHVLTVAAKGGAVSSTGPDLSKMNPALQRGGGTNAPTNMGPPKTMGRDRMIGKTVMVRKGPHKGLLGIVKDATDTEARVEIHAKNKTLTIPKDNLNIKDAQTGNTITNDRFGGPGSRRPGGMGAPGGGYGGSTPSRTPAGWQSGSRTPMAANGSATPAWGLSNSRRPGWDDGGKTPGWGKNDGGRTPGWQDGSRTVAHRPGDGRMTAYGGATAYGGVSLKVR